MTFCNLIGKLERIYLLFRGCCFAAHNVVDREKRNVVSIIKSRHKIIP